MRQVKSQTSHGSVRAHPPCMSSHSNPFPHLQCISTKFPFTVTPCQITAAAYDGQKHIFRTVHENGTLLDSLSCPTHKVVYLSHAMCHVTSAASSFLCVTIRIFMNSRKFY